MTRRAIPDNTYQVVVQASDGGTSNLRSNETEYLTWFKVTVMVTDVEEAGSIKLNPHAFTDSPGDPVDRCVARRYIGAAPRWCEDNRHH